jgi:hypothetical protein
VLLLDNSAWSHIVQGALSEERAETIASWIEQGELATCLPFLLEAGYSARSAGDREAMFGELERLPHVEITRDTERLVPRARMRSRRSRLVVSQPGSSNRAVGASSGILDQGQASKLYSCRYT